MEDAARDSYDQSHRSLPKETSMDNYIAAVFDSDQKAFDALHEFWKLNDRGDITVHGTAVIHRDKYGFVDVATKETYPGLRTAAGGANRGALRGLAPPV